MNNLIPYVIDKTLEKKEFNPNMIYESLLRETDISENNAKKVMEEVARKLVVMSKSIKNITSPMIREITNVTLLQFGLEEERLRYTRIGFPFNDLLLLFTGHPAYYSENKINEEIINHVRNEFYNVIDIIKKLIKNKGNINSSLPIIKKS